jgi:N-acyl-D-amino-acid deacylase
MLAPMKDIAMRLLWSTIALAVLPGLAACSSTPDYDLVVRHGTLYDGSGAPGQAGDLAIRGDRIVAVGSIGRAHGREEIDATGLAVAPGFINMLSHSEDSLLQDPRSQSEIRQGVTLEVFGEMSMGPLNARMKQEARDLQGDIRYDITWDTLRQYLDQLQKRGIAPNVASFVGASTVRDYVLGEVNRAPTPAELEQMKALVDQAMREGALGVTTALIYAPAAFAGTDELIELSKVAARYGGLYTAHLRSEGDRFLEAIDETLRIAREAQIPVEIYHLKAAGESNWPKMRQAIAKIDAARAAGLQVTADMYDYTAGATGFDAAMPPWVQEGGVKAWIARLQEPAIRARVIDEMRQPARDWESLYRATGSPDRVLLLGFKTDALKPLTGKTLGEVARSRGTSPEDTIVDLVIADGTRVEVAYFLMSEDNVRLEIAQPWMSFGSDAGSSAPEGVFLKASTHPRAYGNFARLLGHYVRDEHVIPLAEAIRRLTLLPATNLHLERRGALRPGYYADLAIFDPATIADHSTYDSPRQYATGMKYVIVNGVTVLRDGEHTGALPGRVVPGPGARQAP